MGRTKGLEQFKLPRWEELPSIDLYLDQVLSLSLIHISSVILRLGELLFRNPVF